MGLAGSPEVGPENHTLRVGSTPTGSTTLLGAFIVTAHFVIDRAYNFKPADLLEAEFSSLSRVLRSASIEKKPQVFLLMCRVAREYIDAERQAAIAGLELIARESGLTALIGDVFVQDALVGAFGGPS